MPELISIFENMGLNHISWQELVMIGVGILFVTLAIKKDIEPYELLPIGLGIIVGNLPLTGITFFNPNSDLAQDSGIIGVIFHYGLAHWNILPPLIFLGLGAMTDFGPLISNPKTLLLGAAAQIGIFVAFWTAIMSSLIPGFEGFSIAQAAVISIIGGADGPTTIFLSGRISPELLGITAVVAYSYMALVAIIQPPIMKLLTTKNERLIRMKSPVEISKTKKIVFPMAAMLIIILIVPQSAPLIAMFMIGNIFKESGVVPRLTSTVSNELLNLVTTLLMITIGAQLAADKIFHFETTLILSLGLMALILGTAFGVLFAKIMNLFIRDKSNKINPLIGSAGVSAVPMAARISHQLGQSEDSDNYLLPHAMAPNVAGVIGSAVVAGIFVSLIN
ncbi:MAG: glutaconyl-CoA decarboxylase subunit beta [Chloroflexi bacterium]|nr:glutaconyl-CoA decarboxylase subunit beta [Chloroflexota bacterium]|tara:strand:- start:239 stop:1411 length:1173 start_codon:yes stop_codon:yes gene_type:complete